MSSHVEERVLVSLSLLRRVPLLSGQGSTLMTSLNLNHLLKGPISPVQLQGVVSVSTYEWGGVIIQSTASI